MAPKEASVSALVPAADTRVRLVHLDSGAATTVAELHVCGAIPPPPPQGDVDAATILNAGGSRSGIYLVVFKNAEILDVGRLLFPGLGRKGEGMETEEEDNEEKDWRLRKKEEEDEENDWRLGKKKEEEEEKTDWAKWFGKKKKEEEAEKLLLKLWPGFGHACLTTYSRRRWKMTKAYTIQWLSNDEFLGSNGKLLTYWRRDWMSKVEFEGPLMYTSAILGLDVSLEDFTFCKELGRGSVGCVMECSYLSNRCAVKLISASHYFNPMEISEVDIMSSLKDERTVTFYQAWFEKRRSDETAYGVDEQYINIHMEICERTLADFIRTGNVETTEAEKWELFQKVADAVKYIHHQGIIHRDLKPANIFLGMDGRIKLADFGHSCWFGRGARGSDHLGTMLYIAPELRNRDMIASDKVDIYSLGVIYLEMFVPYHKRFDALYNLTRGNCNINWPVDFWFLMELTAFDPNDRPSIDEVLETISSKKAKTDGGHGEVAEGSGGGNKKESTSYKVQTYGREGVEPEGSEKSKSEIEDDDEQDGKEKSKYEKSKKQVDKAAKSLNKKKESTSPKKGKTDGVEGESRRFSQVQV